jgi:ATP-dependent DNA helicase DinG
VPAVPRDYLSTETIEALRAAILDAGGNEVFLLGTVGEGRKVGSVRVLARGNRHAVPALLQVPRPGEVVIHNHPSGVLRPSEADLQVAAALGNNGVGVFIVDNTVSSIYVVVEPQLPAAATRVDAGATAALLAPGGAVAARLQGYEHRPQQMQMLAAVTAAFNDGTTLTVEAGTGTGKSLAYLLPAIQWSVGNGERVVVSTHTINLQEQLIAKDLPFLTRQAGLECKAALIKGRGNYLCRRKAAQVEAQGALLVADDLHGELEAVLRWAARTTDGSLSDLPVRPRAEVWEQVVSENDNCLRARCPYYSTCFFYSARRKAVTADIIVANHHLLLADLALREETGSYIQNAVLPPARRVIIDEAHHLEDVATGYFAARLSYAALERVCGRLQGLRDPAKGVLPALLVALESISAPDARIVAQAAARLIETRLLPKRASVLVDAEQGFSELLFGLEEALGHEIAPGAEEKVRVVPAFRAHAYWSALVAWLTRLGNVFGEFAGDLDAVCERLENLPEAEERQTLFLGTELRAAQGRIAAFAIALHAFLDEDENTCRWIELRHRARTGKAMTFCSAPVAIGPLLRSALFEQYPTVVLTSATLAVDGSFAYFHEHVGLDSLSEPDRVQSLRVASPFDYDTQALLAVPRDLPDPNQAGYEAATHAMIDEILQVTGGGTFVLFTAYGALNRATAALSPRLRGRGLSVLQQGEMNRQLLLRRFTSEPAAVLFATDSFWEGVDVRGDALRCVIITRLPFRVPTEPIEQARVEAITARGGNAFAEHTVPQAVIKLKQGFGRLIRSRSDRGAVVLLDSRVARKHYGRVFLDSLPEARRLIASRDVVLAGLQSFFSTRAAAITASRSADIPAR